MLLYNNQTGIIYLPPEVFLTMMRLNRFRVKNFRSLLDTGWVECQNVTAFCGENESGKTSLLLALMKLMDTRYEKEGLKTGKEKLSRVDLEQDLPIDKYFELLPLIDETYFIDAEFEPLDDELNNQLTQLGVTFNPVKKLVLSKTYTEKYTVDFQDDFPPHLWPDVVRIVLDNMPSFEYHKEVVEAASRIDFLTLALKLSGSIKRNTLTASEKMISDLLSCLDIWESNLVNSIMSVYEKLSAATKKEVDFREIFKRIPLFEKRIARGFAILNKEFLQWWEKDDITIGYEPYNKGIIIKIIDKHGNSFNLENRSTGFRRFFALFLSFSILGKNQRGAILLFDEAGAALHPLMQRNLEKFFNELGKQSQVLYNTHTAYMLSVENLNRVRVVYKDNENHSHISTTLKVMESRENELSLFPVQAALATYVAEKQMAGCLPIVVLNDNDEYYLSLMKNILTARGKLNTVHTVLVFATGENGIDAVAEAFSNENDLPLILLPSDAEGKHVKERLLADKYMTCPQKIFELGQFVKEAQTFEDLMPGEFMQLASHVYLKEILGEGFFTVFDKEKPILPQIEAYAQETFVELPKNYRNEMAKRMKLRTMLSYSDVLLSNSVSGKHMSNWLKIWRALLA